MVGDKQTDVEAARRAHIGRNILLDPATPVTTYTTDYWRVPNLAAVTALLHINNPS
jgi:histidinol phosphatase-like enzyme